MEKVTINVPKGMELKQEGNTYTLVKKEFKLEVGKDYIDGINSIIVIDRIDSKKHNQKGFIGTESKFAIDIGCWEFKYWREATKSEVREAFKKELVRRYGKDWKNIKIERCAYSKFYFEDMDINTNDRNIQIEKYLSGWEVWNKNGCLYYNGKWADELEEKPKWEDFGDIMGWYIDKGEIHYIESRPNCGKILWPSYKEAEAALALSQLCQWRDKYNEGWKPDWANNRERKHCIIIHKDLPQKDSRFHIRTVLAFKTIDIRNRFLEDFEDLIKVAIPLL